MPNAGFNSILFEFESIVDKELSIMKYLIKRYSNVGGLKLTEMKETGLHRLKLDRIYNPSSTLKTYMTNKDRDVDEWIKLFISNYEEEVLNEAAVFTDAVKLLDGYKEMGNGIIKTTVRCDNKIEACFIKNKFNTGTIIEDRKTLDSSNYGRFIFSNYKQALDYDFNEPKSILIQNFRENFTLEDSTLLKPELVISLGDINDINVIPAFDNISVTEKTEG